MAAAGLIDPPVASPFGALRGALDSGASNGLQVLGDSTGNDPTEWVRLVTDALATAYPAYQVLHRLWDDATQAYGAETQIQAGTGGERYLRVQAGLGGDFHSSIAAGTGYVTGDLDVRVKVALDNWTAAQCLVACFGAAPNRAWRFHITASGKLVLETTADGTTLLSASSTVNPTVTNGVARWVRATIDVDNLAGGRTTTFYDSADGLTWNTVGTAVTNAGTTTINAPAGQPYELGGRGNNIDLAAGNYHRVEIRNGIDGAVTVAPILADAWMPQNRRCYALGGTPILYVVNGSMAGAGISYLGDATRSPKLTPDYGQGLTLLSNSHNDLTRRGPSYLAEWDAWLTKVRTRLPAALVGLVTQNPKRAAIDYALDHLLRRGHLMGWATKNGVPVVDVMRVFQQDTRGIDALTLADGIHPNTVGSQLWADTMLAALRANAF